MQTVVPAGSPPDDVGSILVLDMGPVRMQMDGDGRWWRVCCGMEGKREKEARLCHQEVPQVVGRYRTDMSVSRKKI